MKKIGLLTFHYPVNYGAVLQTYATYMKLQSLNCDVRIINYYSKEQIGHYNFYKFPRTIKEFLHYSLKSLFYFDYSAKRRKFDQFRAKHFVMTQHFANVSEINYKDYDIVLTGSDQVFNLSKLDRIPYFQPFKKAFGQIKSAYAPSFGISEFNQETKELIKELTLDFDFLSCRELEGANLLSDLLGREVANVLDPVFLLSKEEWNSVANERLVDDDYIFVYDLNGKENLIEIANRIRKNSNQKIVMISNDPMSPIRKIYKNVDIIVRSGGIEDFVSLIKYSSYVITDSFHGLAFSIIFRKQFYIYIALEKAAGRIISLMKNFNIFGRIVRASEVNTLISEPLYFDENSINQQIDKSKNFFNKIVL